MSGARGLWVLLLAGCGRDYCEQMANAAESCGTEIPADTVQACQDALDTCTGEDVRKIDAWYDCTERAGAAACDVTSDVYVAALDCLAKLDGLSDACVVDASPLFVVR